MAFHLDQGLPLQVNLAHFLFQVFLCLYKKKNEAIAINLLTPLAEKNLC